MCIIENQTIIENQAILFKILNEINFSIRLALTQSRSIVRLALTRIQQGKELRLARESRGSGHGTGLCRRRPTCSEFSTPVCPCVDSSHRSTCVPLTGEWQLVLINCRVQDLGCGLLIVYY